MDTKSMIARIATELAQGTEEQQIFALKFWIKTRDEEQTGHLIEDFKEKAELSDSIIRKYEGLMGVKPQWVERVENLLCELEMFRIQEAKKISELSGILAAYGVIALEENLSQAEILDMHHLLEEAQQRQQEEDERLLERAETTEEDEKTVEEIEPEQLGSTKEWKGRAL